MIKLALPTGDLRVPTSERLSAAGLYVEGYGEGSRKLRSLPVPSQPDARVRVFRERDIPMQVALGNYDIGITRLSFVTEMQVRFPDQPIVPLADLQIGRAGLFAAAPQDAFPTLTDLGRLTSVRIASDMPNIADKFARAARFPRYRLQSVWGAAEAYPPEDADLVVFAAPDEDAVRKLGLEPLFSLMSDSLWLIANAAALASKDLTAILTPLMQGARGTHNGRLRLPAPINAVPSATERPPRDFVRLAIPDGHQQRHVHGALKGGGIEFEGYEEKTYVRRPPSGMDGVEVKVIRPQDMAQLVALGEFDLAIAGRDTLNEHLFAFPNSPAYELIDLHVSPYNISAVVDGDLPADTMDEALAYWRAQGKRSITVAAEFPATADHYARSRHFWRYQVMPIAGASEAFVPEDADILIEGTETGKTIAENNLKIIDNINRSTTCVIARRNSEPSGPRAEAYHALVERLRNAGEAALV